MRQKHIFFQQKQKIAECNEFKAMPVERIRGTNGQKTAIFNQFHHASK